VYLLKLIERNLRRNPRRTTLSAVAIALATFIYVVLRAVPGSMDRIVADASGTLRLIVLNRSLPFHGLPARYCGEISRMPGAAACVAVAGWPATYLGGSDRIMAVGEDLSIADVYPDYDLSGQARAAFHRERRGAFAGRVLMKKYGWKPGQQITLRGIGAAHLKLDFILLGMMPSKRYPNVFAFRRDYLEAARRRAGVPNPDLAWTLVVRVDSASDIGPLTRAIDARFRNSDFQTRTLTESDALAGALSLVGNVRAIVMSLCAVVILTVMLIAANSTAMMVRERLPEVAVMRTLGFGRGTLAALLFGECGAVGAMGGIAGAGAALWLFAGGAAITPLGGMATLWVSAAGALEAFAVAIAVALASGLLPVMSALRVAPAIAFARTT
jgi:putative ABC transport system permease protein